ncbi:MAG: OmpA family protein [Myxococcales bacterium]|nr:OmpA family protein [Myxococcales bacterium]
MNTLTHRTRALGRATALAATLIAGSLAAAGCASAPPPPTADMQAFHGERRGADADQIARAEPALVAAADRQYDLAREAHEDDDSAERSHHLRLAETLWQTAETRYREAQVRDGLRDTQGQLAAARAELSRVEGTVHQMRAAIAARRGSEVSTGQREMPVTPREQAEYVLDTAIVDLARADEVNAELRAPALYTQARLAYDAAAQSYTAGHYEQATAQASTATRTARQAYEQALPGWQADAVKQRLEERREQLLASLLGVATPIVTDDGLVSIALVGYFDEKESELRPDRRGALDALAEVIKAFPEYSIRVEGHTTPEGHPTDNLLLSQARALQVREALTERGVDANRVTSTGVGDGEAIADADIPGGQVINRRVDVVFTPRQVEVIRTEASIDNPLR